VLHVGADRMNEFGGLRQSYADFFHAPLKFVASSYLVMRSGADQVN
jgi:hypothetical protein